MRHGGQWGVPEKILELEGVKSIAAGAHSSAVISDEGELYLWGKLLNKVPLILDCGEQPCASLLPFVTLEQNTTWEMYALDSG